MLKLVKKILSLALLGCLLTSCAGLIGPRDIEIPLEKLQGAMDRRFPINKRVLELFEVDLSGPALSLLPEAGRIGLAMDATLAPPFTRQSWRGKLALSGRPYIDAARGAVLLGEARVEQFSVDGGGETHQRQLTRVANVLMEKVVGDLPIYHFRPEDLRYGGVQFIPTRITTGPHGLIISVQPAG